MRTAGPAFSIAFADPTNRPAPMTPAIEIMVMCRGLRLEPRRSADCAASPRRDDELLTADRCPG